MSTKYGVAKLNYRDFSSGRYRESLSVRDHKAKSKNQKKQNIVKLALMGDFKLAFFCFSLLLICYFITTFSLINAVPFRHCAMFFFVFCVISPSLTSVQLVRSFAD